MSREPQDLAHNAAASQQYATAFICSTVPLQSRFPRPRWERLGGSAPVKTQRSPGP